MFTKSGNTYINGEFTIYEQQQIGRGAYGIVYECKKNNLNIQLCAKIIKSMSNNSDYLSRESSIINTLREAHPDNQNLVKVYYCQYQKIDNNDVLIVIMEKCGSNLKDELSQKQKYTSDEVLNILKQLLNGYKPLYEKSILHRDIKPENILISYDNSGKPIYKLADFGIGKINSSNDTTMTKVGTPVYAAPELNNFVNDNSLDLAMRDLKSIQNGKSQVDVYSIGIMLYQFLFGCPPFETRYPDQVQSFLRNLKNTPFKIKEPAKDINSDLLALIEKMIVYSPKDRIKFSEIFSHKLISIQTLQPTKDKKAPNQNPNFIQNSNPNPNFIQNPNPNFIQNPNPNPNFIQNPNPNPNFIPNQNPNPNFIPNQNPNPNFIPNSNPNPNPFPNPNPNPNLRATNPNPGGIIPQTQFRQTIAPRLSTLNQPNTENKQNYQNNFQQPQNQFTVQTGQLQPQAGQQFQNQPGQPSFPLQPGQQQVQPQTVQSQFQPLKSQTQVQTLQSNQQIQIDEIQDTSFFLNSQLSENYFFYSKQTVRLLRQALESITKCDPNQINIYTEKLMDCYRFQEKNIYSIGFLKFYYCLIMRKNKLTPLKLFNSEQDLIQEIRSIMVSYPPKS